MGISQKMLNIMSKVDRIPKNGWNDFHKYAYPLDADVLEYMRPILLEEHVTFWYSIISTNKEGNITKAKFEMTFEDVDSGEKRTATMESEGEDKGDKGVYKAITGAIKYFLLKEFLVPTGDDPEREDPNKHQPKQQQQPKQGRQPNKPTNQSQQRPRQPQNNQPDKSKQQTTSDKQPSNQQPSASQQNAKDRWLKAINELNAYGEECGLTRDELRKQGSEVTKKDNPKYWTMDDIKKIREHIESVMNGMLEQPNKDIDDINLPSDDDLPF